MACHAESQVDHSLRLRGYPAVDTKRHILSPSLHLLYWDWEVQSRYLFRRLQHLQRGTENCENVCSLFRKVQLLQFQRVHLQGVEGRIAWHVLWLPLPKLRQLMRLLSPLVSTICIHLALASVTTTWIPHRTSRTYLTRSSFHKQHGQHQWIPTRNSQHGLQADLRRLLWAGSLSIRATASHANCQLVPQQRILPFSPCLQNLARHHPQHRFWRASLSPNPREVFLLLVPKQCHFEKRVDPFCQKYCTT